MSLFQPDENDIGRILNKNVGLPFELEGDNVLVYSTYAEVRAIIGADKHQVVLKERSKETHAVCLHQDVFFDTDDLCLYKNFERMPFANRAGTVTNFCEHEGVLYDTGTHGKVYKTLSNDPVEVVAEFNQPLFTMCSYGKDMFVAGHDKMFNVFKNYAEEDFLQDAKKTAGAPHSTITGIFSDDSGFRLYLAGFLGDWSNQESYIVKFNRDIDSEIVAQRKDHGLRLVNHNGRLYDVGVRSKLFDTLESEMVLDIDEHGYDRWPVDDIISVPRQIVYDSPEFWKKYGDSEKQMKISKELKEKMDAKYGE